jgi:hypothetical protein
MHECRLENRDTYYETLVKWWVRWDFPVLEKTSLPHRIFVVSAEGIDLYAAPVYVSDSALCWIGFITGNKDTEKKYRKNALNFLLYNTEQYMKSIGYELIMTVSSNPVLKKLFEDANYISSSKNIVEYIKKI